MLRTLNSIFSLLTFILFAIHCTLAAGIFMFIIPYTPYVNILGKIVGILMIVHIIFGLSFILKRLAGKIKSGNTAKSVNQGGENWHFGQNAASYFQLITGILMVFLVIIHLKAYGTTGSDGVFVFFEPTFETFVKETLMVIAVVAHFSVSFPRLCVTLGLWSKKMTMKKMYAASVIIVLIPAVCALIMYCNYFPVPFLGGAQ